MKNHHLLPVVFALTGTCIFFKNNVHASIPIQRSSINEKLNEIERLKSNITSTKAQFEATIRDLKDQRSRLQEKLRYTRQDMKNKIIDLKSSAKKAIDELDPALKKYKETPKLTSETQDAEAIAARAATDTTSLRQTVETLDSIELPKDILD